jgi:hypothetical protein
VLTSPHIESPASAASSDGPRAAPAPLDRSTLAAALHGTARHMRDSLSRSAALGPRPTDEPAVAVVIPCYNEEAAIAAVVADFRSALPQARICVFDNASTDHTADVARAAGAEVFREPRKGKGNVVRRMFADIDADVYVMADGDGTYDAASAPLLVAAVLGDQVDMAVGAREGRDAHRLGHALGNRIFNRLYRALFGDEFGDIFSGYRAFSRRFVKSFPALSSGFEIETELSVHASQLKLPTAEIMLPFSMRAEGTASKLRTFADGWRILKTFVVLLKENRPALFFGGIASGLALVSLVLALPLWRTWLATGFVPRLPTAILCTGLMVMAGLTATSGLILDSLARSRAEQKRILYLAIGARRPH